MAYFSLPWCGLVHVSNYTQMWYHNLINSAHTLVRFETRCYPRMGPRDRRQGYPSFHT